MIDFLFGEKTTKAVGTKAEARTYSEEEVLMILISSARKSFTSSQHVVDWFQQFKEK
jgi:hypothetical protein